MEHNIAKQIAAESKLRRRISLARFFMPKK
jgi:hypothetical protein